MEKARAAAEATKEKAAEIKSKLEGKVPPVAWKIAGIVLVFVCAWFLLDALLLFAALFIAYVLITMVLRKKNRPLPAFADKIALPAILAVSLLVGMFAGGTSSGGFVAASDSSFASIFESGTTVAGGTAFRHGRMSAVQVLSVTADGVLVHYVYGTGNFLENVFEGEAERMKAFTGGGSNDKVVFVKTPDEGYVDGTPLKEGVYVRRGTYSYTTALGGEATVEAYEKIVGQNEIDRFDAEVKKNKEAAAAAREKAQKEADEKAAREQKLLAEEMAKYEAEADKELVYLDKMEPRQRMDEMSNRLKAMSKDPEYHREFKNAKYAEIMAYKTAMSEAKRNDDAAKMQEETRKFIRTFMIWKKFHK